MKLLKLIVILGVFLFLFGSCAIGYKKLTTEKLERKQKRGEVELLLFKNLPVKVADTLSKEYDKYLKENIGKIKAVYELPAFISFTPYIQGLHLKYQDFNSEKFRLPFGYFFRFGKSFFFIPYAEQHIHYPFVYYDGYLYFYGKFLGIPKQEVYKVDAPDYYQVDYRSQAYWKLKIG